MLQPDLSKLSYRPEIDGLRALAVVPVILFHAHVPLFTGGFVGVDIFFVISGYLITSILLSEIATGSFSVSNFYERRARRILPALFVVCVFCLPFAWMWMLPKELELFGKSLLSVAFFLSNHFFSSTKDYFAPSAEEQPLLHTWSLSVEEQFYILFPLLLLWLGKLKQNRYLSVLVLMALASLLLSEWAWRHKPTENFYFLVSRAWEILAGATLAVIPNSRINRVSPATASAFSTIGLMMVGISIFVFGKHTPFPSVFSLLPVLGAVLLIAFANQSNIVGKLLAQRVLVAVGLISYSAYLLHQPILAFYRIRWGQNPDGLYLFAVLILIFILSIASYHWVEKPFRRKQIFKTKTTALASATTCLLLLAIGGYGIASLNFGQIHNITTTARTKVFPEYSDSWRECDMQKLPINPRVRFCEFGDKNGRKTVGLWGDSHAQMLLGSLDEKFKSEGINGLVVEVADCHPIKGLVDSRFGWQEQSTCDLAYKAAFELLDSKVDKLIVSIRWTYRLFPVQEKITSLGFDNQEGGVELDDDWRVNFVFDSNGQKAIGEIAKSKAITEFLNELGEYKFQTVVVQPVPEVGWHVPKYNWKSFLDNNVFPETISTNKKFYIERHEFIVNIMNSLSPSNSVTYFEPANVFCPDQLCFAQMNGQPWYFDHNHLSTAGAKMLVNAMWHHISN